MKATLLIFFIQLSLSFYSQNFSLNEVINLKTAEEQKFITTLENKGYKFIKNSGDTAYTFAYNYRKNQYGEGVADSYLIKYTWPKYIRIIYFTENSLASIRKELDLNSTKNGSKYLEESISYFYNYKNHDIMLTYNAVEKQYCIYILN